MSLGGLAELVHYSKGYLSKIETGSKNPPSDLARRCDTALGTEGALTALVPARSSAAPLSEAADDGEVWLMNLTSDGSWFKPMNRRDVLVTGAASVVGFGLSSRGLSAAADESTSLTAFGALFDQLRLLGQTASPGVVLPALVAQTHTLRELATHANPRSRQRLLALGARYAEYAGWMAQESGDDQAALWWTDRAVEMAKAGGDEDLASYSLVRRALVTFYREDATQTIDLARRAQGGSVPPRIRGLAAQREAQGHAIAGSYDACFRSLDRARVLLSHAAESDGPVLGTTNLSDPAAMIHGWCLYDLGKPREAAEALDLQIALLSPKALRSQARYGVRRALAYASANEVDHACELTIPLLDVVDLVGSATVNSDLRKLARALSRFHTHSRVRELYPRLSASLHSPML